MADGFWPSPFVYPLHDRTAVERSIESGIFWKDMVQALQGVSGTINT